MKNLFISHSVFLTPKERRSLSNKGTTIETVGISVPGSATSQEIQEIFYKYYITNEPMGKFIDTTPDGYKIYIAHNKCNKLLDIREGGSEWMLLKIEEQDMHHQVIIADISILENSTISLHWPECYQPKPSKQVSSEEQPER